ncbi:hypothetical protein TCDM_09854 [Trypanosoma cruzi Dm28c]|uniref:Uncharacterized protein n=1 Tax=Trypanosoma cruzi Dm28c TaxID=1416333 RepID=V5BDI3_TRYCR|nr:hypothetical protein TCDM_09854 [Trypanosoma cruzi Dm28c]
MAAPRSCPLGSAVLRCCWDRVCAPASAGTSSRREHRHSLPSSKRLIDVLLPTPRHTGTRPADHKQLSVSVAPSLPHTEEAEPPRPPPEPPPGVSTAPPRRTTSSGSTSPCQSCSSVFSSVHNMKAHARRTIPGTPIVAEGLTCGSCDSSTVSPTSASRAGHHQKCQAYQRAKNGQRTSASSNDSRSPSATPLLQSPPAAEPDNPREALPHTLWECPRPRQLSIRQFGNTPSRTTAPFKTEKLTTSLRTARRPLTNSGCKGSRNK